MHLDEASAGTEVALSPGDVLELTLTENRTTGHRWSLVEAGTPICALRQEGYDPGGVTPGAAGRHHWVFEVTGRGAARLELAYGRSWSGAPARRFAVRLVVA